MKVNDVIAGAPLHAPALADIEDPFLDPSLLNDAQITSIVVDVLAGTVGILLELRQTPHLRANTGLIRVTGVAQQNWICTTVANEFTAWSISGATVHSAPTEFQLTAQCLPTGMLRVVGTSAEFVLLDAGTLDAAPPDYRADSRELIRFGVADQNTDCEVVGVARSVRVDAR
jgi:hypothetical protein